MTPQIFPPARLILLEMRLRAAQRRPDEVCQLIVQLRHRKSPRHPMCGQALHSLIRFLSWVKSATGLETSRHHRG
jgi:hypothetical protein